MKNKSNAIFLICAMCMAGETMQNSAYLGAESELSWAIVFIPFFRTEYA